MKNAIEQKICAQLSFFSNEHKIETKIIKNAFSLTLIQKKTLNLFMQTRHKLRRNSKHSWSTDQTMCLAYAGYKKLHWPSVQFNMFPLAQFSHSKIYKQNHFNLGKILLDIDAKYSSILHLNTMNRKHLNEVCKDSIIAW